MPLTPTGVKKKRVGIMPVSAGLGGNCTSTSINPAGPVITNLRPICTS